MGVLPPGSAIRDAGCRRRSTSGPRRDGSPRRSPTGRVRSAYFLQGAIARLAPGVSVEQARARLAAFGAALTAEYPNDYPKTAGWAPRLSSLQEDLVGKSAPALLVLLGAVGFVLLIACANVANLLLARASGGGARSPSGGPSARAAARLVRQLLTESRCVLRSSAAALGLAARRLGSGRFCSDSPPRPFRDSAIDAHRSRRSSPSRRPLGCHGLLFGLVPAIQSSGRELNETLKESARALDGSARRHRLRALLVVGEFALALVLLVGAGLLFQQLLADCARVDLGLRRRRTC